MLFYVPYHVSGFLRKKKKKREREGKIMYLQSSSFLFLTDLGIMTCSFLISRKLTARDAIN